MGRGWVAGRVPGAPPSECKKNATGADFVNFKVRVRSIAYSTLSVDAKEPAAGADIVVTDVGVRGMAQSLQTNSKKLAAGDDFSHFKLRVRSIAGEPRVGRGAGPGCPSERMLKKPAAGADFF